MIALYALAIGAQVVLLVGIWRLSYRAGDPVFLQYFNPFAFFNVFYVLFFIVEQCYYIGSVGNNFVMVGHENFAFGNPESIFFNTQMALLLFLLSVLLGAALSHPYLRVTREPTAQSLLNQRETFIENAVLWLFFAVGLAAIIYLGRTLINSEGFRSELVKTTSGQIATVISFFGNFAYAALLFKSVRENKYVLAAVLIVLFGAATVYTGARSRFLWPTVFAFILLFSSRNFFPKKISAVLSIVLLCVLLIMDPLRKVLTDPGAALTLADFGSKFAEMIEKRNFDGFTNFALIFNSGAVSPRLGNLIIGGRELFMGAFFPSIYAAGVAMGSTLPGYLYMGGGIIGFAGFAVVFGILLGVINARVRRIRNRWILISYLFGIIWMTQIGGDTIESINKMITAMAPGFVLVFATWLMNGLTAPDRQLTFVRRSQKLR